MQRNLRIQTIFKINITSAWPVKNCWYFFTLLNDIVATDIPDDEKRYICSYLRRTQTNVFRHNTYTNLDMKHGVSQGSVLSAWSFQISRNHWDKLQSSQNAALRISTGCPALTIFTSNPKCSYNYIHKTQMFIYIFFYPRFTIPEFFGNL